METKPEVLPYCLVSISLTEVLQGIRKESEIWKIRDLFEKLIFLPMQYSTFFRSAKIYRTLHGKGITIRKPMDCMIASVAIENDISLLHKGEDFEPIERHFKLNSLL